VTTTAVAVLGDAEQFPPDWLFSYRWGKGAGTRGSRGKGERNVLPTGEKITHVTVGGRTSAVVESRQKKIRGEEEETAGKKGKARGKGTRKETDAEETVEEKRMKMIEDETTKTAEKPKTKVSAKTNRRETDGGREEEKPAVEAKRASKRKSLEMAEKVTPQKRKFEVPSTSKSSRKKA
jgi:formamidopyrimidine-DNA glycosylase